MAIYNICTKKNKIVQKNIETEKYYFLEKVYKIDNPFYLAFYEQSIECAVADAYEFFVELEYENNFFNDNLHLLNKNNGRRFLKLMALYHTIRVIVKGNEELDAEEISDMLFDIFEFDCRERALYELLYKCAMNYECEFQGLFNKTLAKYLFGKDVSNSFTLAFIQNFCYNSYYNFLKSFTKYITFTRRLEMLANE